MHLKSFKQFRQFEDIKDGVQNVTTGQIFKLKFEEQKGNDIIDMNIVARAIGVISGAFEGQDVIYADLMSFNGKDRSESNIKVGVTMDGMKIYITKKITDGKLRIDNIIDFEDTRSKLPALRKPKMIKVIQSFDYKYRQSEEEAQKRYIKTSFVQENELWAMQLKNKTLLVTRTGDKFKLLTYFPVQDRKIDPGLVNKEIKNMGSILIDRTTKIELLGQEPISARVVNWQKVKTKETIEPIVQFLYNYYRVFALDDFDLAPKSDDFTWAEISGSFNEYYKHGHDTTYFNAWARAIILMLDQLKSSEQDLFVKIWNNYFQIKEFEFKIDEGIKDFLKQGMKALGKEIKKELGDEINLDSFKKVNLSEELQGLSVVDSNKKKILLDRQFKYNNAIYFRLYSGGEFGLDPNNSQIFLLDDQRIYLGNKVDYAIYEWKSTIYR